MKQQLDFAWERPAGLDIRRIPVAAIDIPESYEREDSLVEDDVLRKSIEKSGVQQAIVVNAVGKRFIVVNGARRVRTAAVLRLHFIPAIVDVPPPGVNESAYRDRLRFVLNNLRQPLKPSQRAALIVQAKEMFGMSNVEIAAYMGIAPKTITTWLTISDYSAPVIAAIDANEISLTQARALVGMTPEGQQRVWRAHRKEFEELSGERLHKVIRAEYPPEKHPDLYADAAMTIERMSRAKKKRAAKPRVNMSHSEKNALMRDLSMRETELRDAMRERTELESDIRAATPPIRAILRDAELMGLLPGEVREELERFGEVYC